MDGPLRANQIEIEIGPLHGGPTGVEALLRHEHVWTHILQASGNRSERCTKPRCRLTNGVVWTFPVSAGAGRLSARASEHRLRSRLCKSHSKNQPMLVRRISARVMHVCACVYCAVRRRPMGSGSSAQLHSADELRHGAGRNLRSPLALSHQVTSPVRKGGYKFAGSCEYQNRMHVPSCTGRLRDAARGPKAADRKHRGGRRRRTAGRRGNGGFGRATSPTAGTADRPPDIRATVLVGRWMRAAGVLGAAGLEAGGRAGRIMGAGVLAHVRAALALFPKRVGCSDLH